MGNAPARPAAVVSFEDEALILVDHEDREIGHLSKAAAHHGNGRLHRAFSLFVFDPRGHLLLQKRAAGKRLWPGYWSNTCCSHPRRGESIDAAIHRRLHEELRLQCPLAFLFKFRYQAQFDERGAENELCSVFAGRSGDPPALNLNEISELRYVAPDVLDQEIQARPQDFTPWFKIEWSRIRRDHAELLTRL
ncbi:isopentenyl-diphosphate Delta-isomerase [Panacagrimonas sp.]|uniref:isopentenyl-diphosphate Delta-isomerase n=1 Tax=Panacagrimonas sp. TaxID=2480088 RepID=UPI003B5182A4